MQQDELDLPFLTEASEGFKQEFARNVQRVKLTAGQFICMENDQCVGLPIVVAGTARVYKMSDAGRELTLYRIDRGDSCILTASCLASDRIFPAFAVAETEVDAWFISAVVFRKWIDTHPEWRNYVFELTASRLGSVIELVEEIAFSQMDVRLATHLLDESKRAGGVVQQTHERIATDLGTSREVISRLLKDLEKRGFVSLARGAVHVNDESGLVDIAPKSR